ncbi:MAG: methyltransferase domain-containing protein [Pirellulales bacterium]
MNWLPDLSRRCIEPEVMDDPSLDADLHREALRSLSRLNGLSLSSRILWGPIRQLAAAHSEAPLRILDIATGSADIPVALCRRAHQHGLSLQVTAIDISPRAIEFAEQRAAQAGVKIAFQVADILGEQVEQRWPQQFDVVMCSLFLHHLTEDQQRCLLKRMAKLARRFVLVNDLCRGLRGYWLAHAAARVFSRSSVVHIDGPLSVRAALTVPEVRRLAMEAGLPDAKVSHRWPFRYLLQWQPPRRPAS